MLYCSKCVVLLDVCVCCGALKPLHKMHNHDKHWNGIYIPANETNWKLYYTNMMWTDQPKHMPWNVLVLCICTDWFLLLLLLSWLVLVFWFLFHFVCIAKHRGQKLHCLMQHSNRNQTEWLSIFGDVVKFEQRISSAFVLLVISLLSGSLSMLYFQLCGFYGS